jgi:hypothetical protein
MVFFIWGSLLLLDIPRLRSTRDRSVAPAAGVFWFWGGFGLVQTGLADFIFPREWHHQKGPEIFSFHPVESGKGVFFGFFCPFRWT